MIWFISTQMSFSSYTIFTLPPFLHQSQLFSTAWTHKRFRICTVLCRLIFTIHFYKHQTQTNALICVNGRRRHDCCDIQRKADSLPNILAFYKDSCMYVVLSDRDYVISLFWLLSPSLAKDALLYQGIGSSRKEYTRGNY